MDHADQPPAQALNNALGSRWATVPQITERLRADGTQAAPTAVRNALNSLTQSGAAQQRRRGSHLPQYRTTPTRRDKTRRLTLLLIVLAAATAAYLITTAAAGTL